MATIDKSVFLSSQTVEWPTPQYLFEQLDREFGFTIDVAANPTNAKCPRFYTVDDDGISQDWTGEVVWCNPPYGDQLKHWVHKAAHSGTTVVMLVPARTDVKWFHDYVLPLAEIRFIKGRLKFGDATTPAPFPTMLCIWRAVGQHPDTACRVCGHATANPDCRICRGLTGDWKANY